VIHDERASKPEGLPSIPNADARWQKKHRLPDLDRDRDRLLAILRDVEAAEEVSPHVLERIQRRHIHPGESLWPRDRIVHGYRQLCQEGTLTFDREMLRRLQRKPIRTLSGVAPLTVLTKPYPCPGQCIFCPTVDGMPKSYLPDEPGAARAVAQGFDPFRQTQVRLRSFAAIGHDTGKVELLILGGTWSAYPEDYQRWFVRRCLDALNGVDSPALEEAQRRNESARHRNVGLVIETRPDMITPAHLRWLRHLGVTKVQLGVQSLDDNILAANRRGHTVEDVRRAVRLLRLGGFKTHLHWMPNLFEAAPESDRADFARLWDDPAIRPDELKIYPCSLLVGTELYEHWQQGLYAPYDEQTLVDLLVECKTLIPPYCRVSRLMRDIPAPHIVTGVTKSNLRQIVQREMQERDLTCRCIRCREVRGQPVRVEDLRLETIEYDADVSQEQFLSYVTPAGRLVGFLRLSLPRSDVEPIADELRDCAMIREVHVYGPALSPGTDSTGEAQHLGLGSRLIEEARRRARRAGYRRLAVISAIGTRAYYRKRGFTQGKLYQIADDL
jgi:elongator complex protein 3